MAIVWCAEHGIFRGAEHATILARYKKIKTKAFTGAAAAGASPAKK
jgi:hypothetical protein